MAMIHHHPDDEQNLPIGQSSSDAAIDWQLVLDEHDRWLRTVVYARLGEPQGVDEVMQEVALAAVRQHAPLKDRQKVSAWLYRLAVTQSLLYRRKLGRQRKLIDRYVLRTRPGEQDYEQQDPLNWLISQERRKMIRAAVKQLLPKDAEVLLLKYTEDWSYQEIAEHLGISESAVEARLYRARKHLRETLTAIDVIGAGA
jgi:RNA polymerase sigma factor (sigma-70 family)